MARELRVEIIGDARSLNRALNSSQSTTKGFANNIKNMGKVAVGVAGAAGIGALVYGLKAGINEFKESQLVAAQTNAVLKSTGGVAGITAKHVDDLATSIMKKTGIDDEAVKTSENLLLAFTNIRNEVGKGNDIFDRATKIVQDYSVRTGKSATQASIAFGKALQDPIKGLGGLSKAGVILSESQKKTIKSMVESGHSMEAQKFLLGELEKRYGGAAEAAGKTLPGQINILRESFNNFAGDLVAKSIPAIEKLITLIRSEWPKTGAAIQTNFQTTIKPALVDFGNLNKQLAATVRANWPIISPIVKATAAIVRSQINAIAATARALTSLLRGDWGQAWASAKKATLEQARPIQIVAVAAFDAVRGAVRAAGAALGNIDAAFKRANRAANALTIKAAVGAFHALADAVMTVVHAVEALIGALGRIHVPKIHLPSVGSLNPFRADGGPVKSGMSYIVGERGPELFTPGRSGGITPNSALRGGGGGGGMTVQLVLPDGRMVAEWLIDPLKNAAAVRSQRTGRPVFG